MSDFTLPRVTLLDWLRFKLQKPWFVIRVKPRDRICKFWALPRFPAPWEHDAILIGGPLAGKRMRCSTYGLKIPDFTNGILPGSIGYQMYVYVATISVLVPQTYPMLGCDGRPMPMREKSLRVYATEPFEIQPLPELPSMELSASEREQIADYFVSPRIQKAQWDSQH